MRKITLRVVSLLILMSLVTGWGVSVRAQANLPVSEAKLSEVGAAYEINPGTGGKLWVSDYTAGEIWGIDPATGEYSAYEVGGSPTDARQAGDYLWWADDQSRIGRLILGTGDYTYWPVGESSSFLGTAIDDQGRIYAADSSDSYLYRLDSSTIQNNLCTYTLLGGWKNAYMAKYGDYLWLSDWPNSRIIRLQISNGSNIMWTLQASNKPYAMAADTLGNLWYIDTGTNSIANLDTGSNQVTRYAIPGGTAPTMLAMQGGFIWFTDQGNAVGDVLPFIGRLDPLVASHTTFSPTVTPNPVPPCSLSTVAGQNQGQATVIQGTLDWVAGGFTESVYTGGWHIYQAPAESAPWGIAITDAGYVVDWARNNLIRFPLNTVNVFIPVIRR